MSNQAKILETALDRAVHKIADQHSIIATTDANGIITYVNENFVRLSGYTREDLIGQTHAVLNSGFHPPEFFEKLWKHILEGKTWKGLIQNKAKNGRPYWVDTTIMPEMNQNGRIVSFTSIRTDVSNLVKETQRRKRETRKAQAADKAKATFFSLISHEIRTPMNGIIGMTQSVLKSDLNIIQYNNLKAIESSAHDLMVVLKNILDMSKIEAGGVSLKTNTFSLEDLLQNVFSLWKPEITKKGLELQTIFSGDLAQYIVGDETQISKIVSNLVSNACKFTETGHIKLRVTVKEEGEKMGFELRVEDTGPGIDQYNVARIFEPFTQTDQSSTRKIGGAGLGLSICSEMTKLMGGTLKYDSNYEGGAAFILKLSFEKAVVIEGADEAQPGLERSLSLLKILVAEDSKINRMVLKGTLENEPYDLVFANDGAEAVELASSQKFDVILMDIQMPIMDGLQATNLIRNSNNPNSKTPIIAVTANVMKRDREKYLNSGMDSFIAKPINIQNLIKTINTVVDNSQLNAESIGLPNECYRA